jgi:hypothetical protein
MSIKKKHHGQQINSEKMGNKKIGNKNISTLNHPFNFSSEPIILK